MTQLTDLIPYWTGLDGSIRLYHGDCLAVMATLGNASVDAVVTDPPYSLSFMGREWDTHDSGPAYQKWCEEWARECLRVLKPGGHLLAFGATRTYHRLACGIEDAGFEIRDSLHWMHGQGFPKGQDIGKLIDRRRSDRERVLQVTAWLAEARDAAGWTNRMLNDAFGHAGDRGAHWTTQGVDASVPGTAQWDRLRELLGFDDTEILPLVEELNGRKGLLGEDWSRREVTGQAHRVRRPSPVQIAGLSDGDYDLTAPAAETARAWEGWNTTLKPAHEPIILARKSTGFHSTVANILLHGTGAINIDACRVSADGRPLRQVSGNAVARTVYGDGIDGSRAAGSTDQGRWPPNVVFSHAPGCQPAGTAAVQSGTEIVAVRECVPGCPVAELDAQSGALEKAHISNNRQTAKRHTAAFGDFAGTGARAGYTDVGAASRFFPAFRYEPKAPVAERPRLPDGRAHETVKPLELMKFLARLVTRPGGLVLDPFAGTCTTGQACAIEGMDAILIEQDAASCRMGVQRLSKPVQQALFPDLG